MVQRVADAAVDLRQQRRTRLHRAFLVEQTGGLGDGQLRIAGARQLIGLHQVGGAGRGRQGQGEREYEGATAHAGFLV